MNEHEKDLLETEEEITQIELVDEEGQAQSFSILDVFDFEQTSYAILMDEEEEAFVFRVEDREDEEFDFITPEEEEFERVSAYYNQLLDEAQESEVEEN